MGYTSANAQLMTIPIYVTAMIATVIVAFWADHVQQRTPFIIGGFAIGVAGFIAQLAIPHPKYPGVAYFFLFLVATGLYCPFTCIVALVANNLAPSSKRAVGEFFHFSPLHFRHMEHTVQEGCLLRRIQ
jgi:hypothetical protein